MEFQLDRGAVENICGVQSSSSVAVFGLGAVGLSVIQAAKAARASYIVGVDIVPDKFEYAKTLGAHVCVNPKDCPEGIKETLLALQTWGFDYTFDCTGNVAVMTNALEVAHRGWGTSCVIGVAAAGEEIRTRPFQLITGRTWKGAAFGGWKSRSEIPKLVKSVLRKEFDLSIFRTHVFQGLDRVNEMIYTHTNESKCLRAVMKIAPSGIRLNPLEIKIVDIPKKTMGGKIYRISHWSQVNSCHMTFSLFLPTSSHRSSCAPPVLYFLAGLQCSDETAITKIGFQDHICHHNMAMVFPDTSARGVDIQSNSPNIGLGCGFYLNATTPGWVKHNQIFTYVVEELPFFVNNLFPVDPEKRGITGHSMGGHGALTLHLKNPGRYQSVSAFAPIVNPTESLFGKEQFTEYLGSIEAGKDYDATELVKTYDGPLVPILIDQGDADVYLDRLLPEHFVNACKTVCLFFCF